MRRLSELESVTLAHVRTIQPCTTYAVRRCFQASPSGRYAESAGSLYPMMRRLEREGLLRSRATSTGRRRSRLYECTRAGLAAIREWLGPPLDPSATMTADPLRTRMIYLSLLTPARRRRWLDEGEEVLGAQRRAILAFRESCPDYDEFMALANEHALRENTMRAKWIKVARDALEGEGLMGGGGAR